MSDFHYELVDPDDDALLQTLYEMGRDNIPPAAKINVCSPYPYALRNDLERVARRGHLAAIYEEGFGLRSYIGFSKEGRVAYGAAYPFETDYDLTIGKHSARGEEHRAYLYSVPAQVVGQTVVQTRNEAYAADVSKYGVQTEPLESPIVFGE